MRDHTNSIYGVAATTYWTKRDPQSFRQKLNIKDDDEHSGEAKTKAPLVYGEISWLSMELHNRELAIAWAFPCMGLQRGLGGSLCASRYHSKNIDASIGVCISVTFEHMHLCHVTFDYMLYLPNLIIGYWICLEPRL